MTDSFRKDEMWEKTPETERGLLHLWFRCEDAALQSFPIFERGTSVLKVEIGQKHCAILSTDGVVYMYGNNQYGQLGIGDYVDRFKEPVRVTDLEGEMITDVSCGAGHTAAVTCRGHVYAWGDSRQGQCATPSNKRTATPVLVAFRAQVDGQNGTDSHTTKKFSPSLTGRVHSEQEEAEMSDSFGKNKNGTIEDEVKIVKVSCGNQHTLAVSESGEVWAWGLGPQLGLNASECVNSPRRIDFLVGRKVLDISAGSHHTVALVQKLPLSSQYELWNRGGARKQTESVVRQTSRDTQATNKKAYDSDQSEYSSHCPLGLEITSDCDSHSLKSSFSASNIKSCVMVQSKSANLSRTPSGDSFDQCAGGFHTADNSPLHECVDKCSCEEARAADNNHDLLCKPRARNNAPRDQGNEPCDQSSESCDQRHEPRDETGDQKNQTETQDQVWNENNQSKNGDSKVLLEQENESLPEKTSTAAQGTTDLVAKTVSVKPHTSHTEPQTAGAPINCGVSSGADVAKLDKTVECETRMPMVDTTIESSEFDQNPSNQQTTEVKVNNENMNSEAPSDEVAPQTSLSNPECVDPQTGDSVESLPKSRSTFLDESEAKEFLDRQLSGEDCADQVTSSGHFGSNENELSTSPLAKHVENFMQYVPNTSTAVAMQEYVTSWTKSVVTNIRTSMETTMDKFGIVSGQGSSLDESEGENSGHEVSESSLNKPDTASVVNPVTATKEFPRFGTLPKSTSMGGNKLKVARTAQRRKGSLPSGAIQIDWDRKFRAVEDVILESEVWTWGEGDSGQLGLGDHLPRLQPCKVKQLSDKRVIKVATGAKHCLVLTADSEVYGWGCNQNGQLGLDNATQAAAPVLIKGFDSAAWDIACGDDHSLVLSSGRDHNSQVWYTGRQPRSQTVTDDVISCFHNVPAVSKLPWIHTLSAGGELCACVSDQAGSGLIPLLHELGASEREYSLKLNVILNSVLKPILNSDSFQKSESSQLGMTIGLLCDAFMCLTDMVCTNQAEVTQVLRHARPVDKLKLVERREQCVGVYQHYTKCFTDAVCMGSFAQCSKACSSIFESAKPQIKALLSNKYTRDHGSVFHRLVKIALSRMKDYCRILGKLAVKFPTHTAEFQAMDEASKLWQAFHHSAMKEINLAESTSKFWSTCSYKLADSLKVAHRRLLYDSKSHPLSLHGAGRFASHHFYLFNDAFVHVQGSSYHNVYHLQTVWVEAGTSEQSAANTLVLTTPEDRVTVVAPSAAEKSDWLWALNHAIDAALKQQRRHAQTTSLSIYPAKDRHASYTFSKHASYKEAKYQGMWRQGLMHGQGELQWADGRKYVGSFKDGMQDGYGKLSILPNAKDACLETHEGMWKNTKLNGYGFINYSNGDSYEGYFKDGLRHGHGVLKQGKLTSSLATIYIGEWREDKRSGYGVQEDIVKGEKFMGMWHEDVRHGNGVIVTIDGVYFEGTFVQNKMTGYGLLITEDGLSYEGEFSGGLVLYGKGVLTVGTGDSIEGSFYGSFSEGIKINGTFKKQTDTPVTQHGFTHVPTHLPKSYGKLLVPAQRKWEEIFDQCCSMLGCTRTTAGADTGKAWSKSAAFIEMGKKMSVKPNKSSKHSSKIPEILEKIPEHSRGHLTLEYYNDIKEYLSKAFECPYHPVGKLLDSLVDVYRATYVGVGAHPRLLQHAVLEVKSFVERMYLIVRILFPDLPDSHRAMHVYPENRDQIESNHSSLDEESETITPGSLLYPQLLPKIYPPLFTLYALYNESEDERYWRRIVLWNRQSDLSLFSYLGVDQQFWTFEATDSPQKLSRIRDKSYLDAIDTLQGLSTSFSPAEKLFLIQNSFGKINAVVEKRLGANYLWSMDDLFPLFQYVVVRSRIQHLGAEIHLMDDLMETHLELGELGLMFTTLKACYFQIQNEKIV